MVESSINHGPNRTEEDKRKIKKIYFSLTVTLIRVCSNGSHFTVCKAASKMNSKLQSNPDCQKRKFQSVINSSYDKYYSYDKYMVYYVKYHSRHKRFAYSTEALAVLRKLLQNEYQIII